MYNKKFHARRKGKPYYEVMAKASMNACKNAKSVLDIGCSCGVLLSLMGDIPTRVGIDYGAAKDEFIPEAGKFIEHDFNVDRCDTGQEFDLIICQEVIEHVNEIVAMDIVDTFYENAKENTVLIFSGAHIGQRGRGHINCCDSWDWIEQISNIGGFYHDSILTNNYIAECGFNIPACYRDNTIIFKKG